MCAVPSGLPLLLCSLGIGRPKPCVDVQQVTYHVSGNAIDFGLSDMGFELEERILLMSREVDGSSAIQADLGEGPSECCISYS